jgi:type II secretory pathway pseudopilin PulG
MTVRKQGGFTYVGLIILVAIIGMVGALTLKADSLLQRAAAEEELLEIGAAFSAALQSYAAATPRGQPAQPPTLQELLKDPRFPEPRRHLRRIFVDPITGKAEWGIVYRGDQQGVMAVYSLSASRPLKVANFDQRFSNFEDKEHISDWKFTANGQGLFETGQPTNPPPAPRAVPVPPPKDVPQKPPQPPQPKAEVTPPASDKEKPDDTPAQPPPGEQQEPVVR